MPMRIYSSFKKIILLYGWQYYAASDDNSINLARWIGDSASDLFEEGKGLSKTTFTYEIKGMSFVFLN